MELIIPVLVTLCILVCSGYTLTTILKLQDIHIFDVAWIGVFCIGLFSSIVHLFFPLTWPQNFLVLIPTFLGTVVFFKKIKWSKYIFLHIVIFLGILFIVLLHAISVKFGDAYDTDLYHLQIVRWLREFTIVPGLGNLHFRLPCSSIVYNIAALFPARYGENTPSLIAILFGVLSSGWFLFSFFSSKNKWEKIYLVAIFPLIFDYFRRYTISNLHADHIAMFIVIIFMYHMLFIFLENNLDIQNRLKIIFLYLALSFTIKPLAVVPILFSIFVTIWLLKEKTIQFPSLFGIFLFPAVMAFVWCLRNVLLSGYPIYPLPVFSFSFDWTMPQELVDSCRNAVRGWARWPREGYEVALKSGITYWFPSWFCLHMGKGKLFFPLMAGLLVWSYLFIQKRSRSAILLFGFTLSCLLYWFYMAPDPRFGLAYFWIFPAVGLCFIPTNRFTELINKYSKYLYFVFALIFIFTLGERIIRRGKTITWQAPNWPAKEVYLQNYNENGKKVFPLWRPKPGEDQCGNCPLPSSPWRQKGLKQRKEGDLQAGFYIEKQEKD